MSHTPHELAEEFPAAVDKMHALRRHCLGQHRMQFAAVKDHVRRAELGFDGFAEGDAGQRAAVDVEHGQGHAQEQ